MFLAGARASDAYGSAMTQNETAPTQVAVGEQLFVLWISHRHGTDTSIHASQDGASASLRGYIEQWWEQEVGDEPIPADTDEAAEIYFERSYNEDWGIDQVKLER